MKKWRLEVRFSNSLGEQLAVERDPKGEWVKAEDAEEMRNAIIEHCRTHCDYFKPYKRHSPSCLAYDLGIVNENHEVVG